MTCKFGKIVIVAAGLLSAKMMAATITVDSSLPSNDWRVRYQGGFVAPGSQVYTLAAGSYTYDAEGGGSFVFTVDALGQVQYDPSLEPFLNGAGTTTLTVEGFAITLDASAISGDWRVRYMTAFLVPSVVPFRLIPGSSYFDVEGNGTVIFSVDGAGKVQYDAALEPVLSGAGSTTLTVDGHAVTFDASALTGDWRIRYVTSYLSPGVYPLRLLASDVTVEVYGVGGFTVTIDSAGNVQYDVSLAGFLGGAGTSTLLLLGYTVTVDATALTGSFRLRYVTNFLPPGTYPMTVGPGTFRVDIYGSGSFLVDVDGDGLVQYDPSLEPFLSGAGTTTLTIDGFILTVDATAEGLTWRVRYTTNYMAAGVVPITLVPGAFQLDVNGSTNYSLTLDDAGKVQYDCATYDSLNGVGTPFLTICDGPCPDNPVANCKNITVTLSGGAASIVGTDVDDNSSDNCGIVDWSVSPASFDCDDLGDNTVTLTVTDTSANTDSCDATVTVVEEDFCPAITLAAANAVCGQSYTNVGELIAAIDQAIADFVSANPMCPATAAACRQMFLDGIGYSE